jgi:hypothetical protein
LDRHEWNESSIEESSVRGVDEADDDVREKHDLVGVASEGEEADEADDKEGAGETDVTERADANTDDGDASVTAEMVGSDDDTGVAIATGGTPLSRWDSWLKLMKCWGGGLEGGDGWWSRSMECSTILFMEVMGAIIGIMGGPRG